jgi:transposase
MVEVETMKYTYQYKAIPTTEQKLELNAWLRICRYWYNRQLGDRFNWWEHNRTSVNACPLVTSLPQLRDRPNYYSQKKYLPELKKQPVTVQWSGEELDFSRPPANTMQEVCKRVDLAFDRFGAGCSNGNRSGKPRFRLESRYRSSVIEGAGLELLSCSIGGKYLYIKVPKIGLLKIRSHRHHIAGKAGAVVIAKNPVYTSQLLAYRDEVIFTDMNIRNYWDETENLWVDRDINAAINVKRVGLDVFPTIKRRKGGITVTLSSTDSTSEEVLHTLRSV